ncbi:MAG: YraN family protein [Ruminococcus sp.]|nr:YraN family protein [Ruminococcus sp.]
MKSTDIGRLGEELVCRWLTEHGYTIEARNFRIKGGEIDIVAQNGDYIAFVEVKTRRPGSMVSGFEAVNSRKKGLIIRAASEYCTKRPTLLQPRFDIAVVNMYNGAAESIEYIQDAFDTTGYKFIF